MTFSLKKLVFILYYIKYNKSDVDFARGNNVVLQLRNRTLEENVIIVI